jgi:3-oxoacyl-[acyl-carrier protein] reductase
MKRCLVTGSSRGIGAQIARKLAADGWTVLVHGSKPSEQTTALCSELGDNGEGPYFADLGERSGPELLWNHVSEKGPLHALVNNAGAYWPAKLLDLEDLSLYEKTFRLNFQSPLELIHRAGQAFRGQGGGKILNVSSRVGFRGEPGAAHYAASKAALTNLTRSLAVEWASHNIGVFGIAPGWVDTAMSRDGMEERIAEILPTIPLGRMASPIDCAAAASFLLSDEAAYLSGVVLDINGASYFH